MIIIPARLKSTRFPNKILAPIGGIPMVIRVAKIAKEEGFPEIAAAMENIGKAEVYHEERFSKLLKEVETQTLLAKNDLVVWKCQNCGFHITSKNAPKICPACGHPQGYFVQVDPQLF